MTIAITIEVFFPTVNGVITASLNLAENLKKEGHNVIFIVPSWKAFTEPSINGIPIHYIPSIATHMYPGVRFVSPWNSHVKKILINQNVDLLLVTGPWLLSWSAMKSARKNGIPVIQVFHTLIYEDTYLLYGVKFRFLLPVSRVFMWKYINFFVKKTDIMTAPSNHACKVLKEHFPMVEIQHIPNGIDLSIFRKFDDYESLRRKYKQFNRKSFLFIGRLGEEKAVSTLIEAFKLVNMQDAECKLFIVGDGPGLSEYEKMVKTNSMEDSVFFLGRIPHKNLIQSGIIHHARAMVTASTTENQPMTILEAIACGTPIIIPDVDGINELLADNGESFPEFNYTDFASKMLLLAKDDNLYQRYKEGSKKLREAFDGKKVAQEFEQLFNRALQKIIDRG